jgi:glycosyltransferase involved in cell wall biosynthesis
MSSTPLVSIITPSYNQDEYIEDTLRSVKNQDYPNVEHIVTDGGSTDKTIEILNEYESKYNLHWSSEPDEGQSDAVNKGFEKAEGEIVGWLNADDVYFNKQVISNIVQAFQSSPEVDVVYGDDVFLDESGRIMRARKLYNWNYSQMLRWGWWGWTPASEATFYRQEVVKSEALDKQLEYVLDYEYFMRLGKKYNFKHINEIIAGKRKHDETKSSNRRKVTAEAKDVLKNYGYRFDLQSRTHIYATLLRIQLQWILGLPLLIEARNQEFAFNGAAKSRYQSIWDQFPKPI